MKNRPTSREITNLTVEEKDLAVRLSALQIIAYGFQMKKFESVNIVTVGMKGVGKSSLINSFYKALDMSTTTEMASVAHEEKDGTINFHGFHLQKITKTTTKIFDTKGILHDSQFSEVGPVFRAILGGHVKDGSEIEVKQKYKSLKSLPAFPIFRPAANAMIIAENVDLDRMDPMHCVIIVLNPSGEFPEKSTDYQVGYCKEKKSSLFFCDDS